MAICRKTVFEISVAILGLTIVVLSALFLNIGLVRYYFNLEDDSFNKRNHYILAGNILSVFGLASALYVLLDSGDQGMPGVIMMMLMLFNLVIVLYLSNYDPSDKPSAVITMVLSVLDLYLKVTAILVGFGTCNTGDVLSGLSGIPKAFVGGRRR